MFTFCFDIINKKGDDIVGRPKGKANKKNRYWSKEEKLRIVLKIVNHEKSLSIISQEENISTGLLHSWVKKYLEQGEEGLINNIKPGNQLAKYTSKKSLTNIEKLEYENMKLRIENERLKKGYLVKGDGQIVIFNGSNNKNMK